MFTQFVLPYNYDAFEPYIDAETMRLHTTKHHASYTQKLNDLAAAHPEFFGDKSIEQLLANLTVAPPEIQTTLRNQGGGFYNHNLYFEQFTTVPTQPAGKLLDIICRDFGEFAAFREQFNNAATGLFGSGWVWLIQTDDGQLKICTTPNQDSPIMPGAADITGAPLLALDIWEHAYYLRYQNRRPEYIDAWWQTVDWRVVARRLGVV